MCLYFIFSSFPYVLFLFLLFDKVLLFVCLSPIFFVHALIIQSFKSRFQKVLFLFSIVKSPSQKRKKKSWNWSKHYVWKIVIWMNFWSLCLFNDDVFLVPYFKPKSKLNSWNSRFFIRHCFKVPTNLDLYSIRSYKVEAFSTIYNFFYFQDRGFLFIPSQPKWLKSISLYYR